MTTKTQGPRHSLPPKVSRDLSPYFDLLQRAGVQITGRTDVKPRSGADTASYIPLIASVIRHPAHGIALAAHL